jgi:hypothetical protein
MERNDTKIFELNLADIPVDNQEIYRTMGYKKKTPSEQVVTDVDQLLQQSAEYMNIKCGYILIPAEDFRVQEESFFIGSTEFNCGKMILYHIKKAEQILVFLATLGENFDNFSKHFFESGDPYIGYLTDTIGSVVVESALDSMMENLDRELSSQNKSCSNRLSPGYCNWNIQEQQKLFSFLPNNFLGVQLLSSSLMTPIKSVSGIIGIGKNIQKMAYSCSICNQKNCIMRRHQKS